MGSDNDVGHRVRCRLGSLLEERSMTLTELSEQVGVSVVNLSVLKNDRAKAVRFSTLTALCETGGAARRHPGDRMSLPEPSTS